MPAKYRRREFIKSLSLLGISLEINPAISNINIFSGKGESLLSNRFFSLLFNAGTGRINLVSSNNKVLMDGAFTRIHLAENKEYLNSLDYNHKITKRKIIDDIGQGSLMIVNSINKKRSVSTETRFTLYDNISAFFIEVIYKNTGTAPVVIKSIEPLIATEEDKAFLRWDSSTVLTNGPMYYDAGRIHRFGEEFREAKPYGPIKGSVPSPDFQYPSTDRIRSWWNAGLFAGYDKEGLVMGFAENRTGLGQIILSKTESGNISLFTSSVFSEGAVLKPGQSLSSGRFVLLTSEDIYSALENYADVTKILNNPRKISPLNGWCSWFYTYEFVTEEEVIRNAGFVATNLKKYGLEYIQVDEGYQRYHGDWEANDRFPNGMKWLSERIKELGLKPGLWVAPFVISEPTELFRNHPDWLLQNSDGTPMRVGPWPDLETDWARNENPKRYGLDISHPEAQKWLFNLFKKMSDDWGYEMFKIDFVAWSILSAGRFHDPSYTPAMAYRKGMEIIRNAIGPEKHINECGPGNITAGLIDSMRIEIDQNYGYSDAVWKQYFLDSSSSAPAAAKRYYFNGKTWINDADHLCINLLSPSQAMAAATLLALSGGNLISGDRLTDLDNLKLDILKKALPSSGEAARPVDLYDTERHTVFALKVVKQYGEWTIAGIFNPDNNGIVRRSLPLDRLWLKDDKKYIAYDFWQEKLYGEVAGSLEVDLLPLSVTLLSLHEKMDHPQFISTDRHILQGALEMEDIRWDNDSGTLSGTSCGAIGTSYNIMVYLPVGISWKQEKQVTYQDYIGYSARLVDTQLMKIRLNFRDKEKISWKIEFGKT